MNEIIHHKKMTSEDQMLYCSVPSHNKIAYAQQSLLFYLYEKEGSPFSEKWPRPFFDNTKDPILSYYTTVCWHCGMGDEMLKTFRAMMRRKKKEEEEPEKGSRPERAHIVAKINGGSYHPKNFFLLCRKCHHGLQPCGVPYKVQIKWIKEASVFDMFILRIKEASDFVKDMMYVAENRIDGHTETKFYRFFNHCDLNKVIQEAAKKSSTPSNIMTNTKAILLNCYKQFLKTKKVNPKYQI